MALSSRFDEALLCAADWHRAQVRKGKRVPYLAHLLGVTGIALAYGATEDEAIAALLHDAIEDQGGAARRAEIRDRFGEEVAAIVEGCTDTELTPKPPWRARKEAYLAHLAQASPSVRLVAAADKLDNVRDLVADYRQEGEAVWTRFNAGRDEQLWFYRGIVEALSASGPTRLVEELGREVATLEQLVQAETAE